MSRGPVLRALGVLLAALVLLAGGAWLARRMYLQPGPLGAETAVVIPHEPLERVGALLAEKGVVANPTAFRLAALATHNEGPLHAGELAFPAHGSLQAVLGVLRFGKPVQHRLTIPEGLTAAQVALLLDRAPDLSGPTPVPAEGGVLPQTYAYEHGTTRAALVARAAAAMTRVLDRDWAARTGNTAPLETARQALILASIVERETARPEERARVAAVFLNRLRLGMKLQSDPTVAYAASGGLGTLDHGITRAELARDDPYNTYVIPALPPGPICMPGAASIAAVTQPMDTDDLYFVADGSGGHAFARTEQEHARNVAHWRDLERERAAAPAASPATTPPQPN